MNCHPAEFARIVMFRDVNWPFSRDSISVRPRRRRLIQVKKVKKSPNPKMKASPHTLQGEEVRPSQAKGEASNASAAGTSPRWTFLTNHAHVLGVLHANPQLVLREVATQVGITERAVQRIVQDLEDEGFIRREKVGRQNHYEVVLDKPLRHPIEAHRNIGELLSLIHDEPQ